MAKQFRIVRKVGTVQVVAGGFATIDLPRDYDYEALFFRLSGTANVTAGATSVRNEAPAQWVPRVEVIADGKNNLCSVPFWALSIGNLDTEYNWTGAAGLTPPSGVAIATYAVEARGVFHFATPCLARPKDSAFRSRGLSLFQARMTFGQPGDIFVGGTVSFSGTPTVDVFAVQLVEEQDAQGNYKTTPIALRKLSYQQIAMPASNANQELRLPSGNLIRAVLLRGDGATTAGEPSNAVFNNIILQNGVDVRFNLAAANVRALNAACVGQVNTGYYLADIMGARGGFGNLLLSDLWDLTGPNEPKAVMDITGGANVNVYAVTHEFILAA